MILKKKSLGQNFLKSPQVISDIVLAAKVTEHDAVLEIGPGEGVLTSELLKTGAHVVSIEKDDRLIPELHKTFSREISLKQLELVHADVLDVNITNLIKDKYKLVANIPYYITGQIIRIFLENNKQPESMTLLVQKEVAERIVARDNKESLLSLSVKIFGDPKLVRVVGRGAFSPQPNVDSAVIIIENISKNKLGQINENLFFKTIRAGFAHKRKQLLPNLSEIYSKTDLIVIFEKLNLDSKVRAEDLTLEKWINICEGLQNL